MTHSNRTWTRNSGKAIVSPKYFLVTNNLPTFSLCFSQDTLMLSDWSHGVPVDPAFIWHLKLAWALYSWSNGFSSLIFTDIVPLYLQIIICLINISGPSYLRLHCTLETGLLFEARRWIEWYGNLHSIVLFLVLVSPRPIFTITNTKNQVRKASVALFYTPYSEKMSHNLAICKLIQMSVNSIIITSDVNVYLAIKGCGQTEKTQWQPFSERKIILDQSRKYM